MYHNHMSERGVIHLLTLLLLVLAVAAGVYLATHPQVFRSRASQDNSFMNALEITDSKGHTIQCDTTQDPPVCNLPTLDFSLRVATPTALLDK